MAKEVLIYGQFDSYSSSQFIEDINAELEKDENSEIVVRVNTPGGDVDYAWGAVAKFSELKNKKTVKVDGKAHSMGLYFCCYTEDVEAVDVSEFLLHRAAYPSWIENDPDYFTEDRQASLDRMNKKLRAAFEGKVDVPLFEQITKVTLDQVYSMEGQLNVRLTAQQAKRIGLIKSYTTITPKKKADIAARMFEITAKSNGLEIAAKVDEPIKIKTMNIDQLKAEHPNVYAQIFALGVTDGVATERDRVEACLTFIDADAKGVKEAIASGKPLSAKQMAEFTLKIVSAKKLEAINGDSAGAVNTEETDPAKPANAATAKKEADLSAWAKGVMANTTTLKAS